MIIDFLIKISFSREYRKDVDNVSIMFTKRARMLIN